MRPSLGAAVCALLLAGPLPAAAEERYALLVAGATGGPNYAQQYQRWIESLVQVLTEDMQFDAANVTVLSETADAAMASTARNVRRILGSLRQRVTTDDLLFIVLIGHGTFDGMDAKFNLVGPDMESSEWADRLHGWPGRLVLVNTASASFPFLERLSGRRRIVISATDSPAQRFDTVFPQYFVAALRDEAADIDENGRVSLWEAFAAASGGVRRHFQRHGQLATERALLDDNGDGVGREAAEQGSDGALASRTYLDLSEPNAPPTDEVLVDLLQRRASLMAEIEELQIKKAFLSEGEYTREFERLMLALARVSREIRARSTS